MIQNNRISHTEVSTSAQSRQAACRRQQTSDWNNLCVQNKCPEDIQIDYLKQFFNETRAAKRFERLPIAT